MKIILPEQFHTDIIKSNKIYLYYKIMEEFPVIFIPYLKYINVFNETAETIFSLY